MPNVLAEEKNKLRQTYRVLRKEFKNKSLAAVQLKDIFFANINLANIKCIAGYQPFDGEIDIVPLLLSLKALNYIVTVPHSALKASYLHFKEWNKSENNFLIPEIVLTPLVAFSPNGDRLGLGKGLYDKTIKILRPQGVKFYGIAYEVQLCKQLPTNKYDQKLDLIITEQTTYLPEFFPN